jgi:hypothetical protein
MTKLRYVPDANEAYAFEKDMKVVTGFTFNPIAVEGLLSRWSSSQVYAALLKVFDKKTMGVDSTLAALEAYLEQVHP